MKKTLLDNKGFAISGIVYTILLLFIVTISTILLILINRKIILDKSKNKVLTELNGKEDYKILTLKERIENETSNIKKGVKVNGEIVNKVIGTKAEKLTMKNYLWYMGNLWQVLETNDEKNTVKLITAHSITSIAYGETSNFNTSWVKKWLNEVFFASLEGTELVKNTTFCLDKVTTNSETIIDTDKRSILKVNSHTKINTCQNSIESNVGLMSFEDYVYSNNGETPIYVGGSYLDEDEFEWTLTAYDNTHNWIQWYNTNSKSYITSNNNEFSIVNGYGHGVRPVLSIDGSAIIKEGDGTKANPFILINEKTASSGSKINNVKVGDYIYLDERNNPNTFTSEYVARDLKYNTTKDKVRYRVVKKNSDGSIKIERADVLRNLSNTISIDAGMYIPYYYKNSTDGCYYNTTQNKWYTSGCVNNNIFNTLENNNEYNYKNNINIGNFLNTSANSFYNWYSTQTKEMIKKETYNRYTGGYGKDYSKLNDSATGDYPNTTNDGNITANVLLPSWGEMFTGNDINIAYWLTNRWNNSNLSASTVGDSGEARDSCISHYLFAIRPVVTLKSEVKIKSGEGTMTNPYSLYM